MSDRTIGAPEDADLVADAALAATVPTRASGSGARIVKRQSDQMALSASPLSKLYQGINRLTDRFLAKAYASITQVAELPAASQTPGAICQAAIGANRLEVVIFQTDLDTVSASLERAGYRPEETIPGVMRYRQGDWLHVKLRKAQTNTQLEVSVDEAYRIEEHHDENSYTITQAVLCHGLREIMEVLAAYRSRYVDLGNGLILAQNVEHKTRFEVLENIVNPQHRILAKLWNDGMSEKNIAEQLGLDPKRVNNLLPELRAQYGEDAVPYRRPRGKSR